VIGMGSTPEPRDGARTKDQILSVAMDLFIEHGYEGTSVRDIADALKVTPSALYYHFKGKEEIATSLLAQRRSELDELTVWIKAEPQTPDLARRAALRWIDHATPAQLQAMRFAGANRPFMQKLGEKGELLRAGFENVEDALLPTKSRAIDRMRVRMLLDTLSASLRAAEGTGATFEDIRAAARAAATALPL
jgi:AcrR family transcriptional regulator